MSLPPTVARRGRLLLLALPLALLLSAAALGARAQEPSPTQTPTPTPTPSPSPTPEEAEAVERIETNITSVLLSATDSRRRFVTTLRAEDLRLTEDGVEQQIETFEQETDAPLSLALLVDVSSSQARVLPAEQDAARAFVASVLKPHDSASVLSFTGLTRRLLPLTNERARVEAAINSITPRFSEDSPECAPAAPEEGKIDCYTAVWDSIAIAVREVLAHTPERTRRAIILLSDGDDTKSQLRIYQAVDYAVRHNTVVYAVGYRDNRVREGSMRRDFLQQITEGTGGRAFFPKRSADLPAVFAQIAQELRTQYLITYTPTNRARDGTFRRLQIELTNPRLKKQNLRLSYRQGYYARKEGSQESGVRSQ